MPRIVVLPADDSGCGWYRLRYPGLAVAAQTDDVEVSDAGPQCQWDADWSGHEQPPPHANVIGLAEPYPADVVVLQRTARKFWAQIIPHLQAAGTRVVVDVDDRMDRIHHANIAHQELSPRANDWRNHRWFDEACKQADLVTCSTPALADRYGYGHAIVLPNLVPAAYLAVDPPERRSGTVGWTGTVDTHPGDLEATRGAVGAALRQSGWSFHVIGTGKGVASRLRLDHEPSATGWVDFADYPGCYAELEVAIVPLADTPFNEAKSALKAMEAAALGIPVVMSPTPDNLRVNRAGVGLVANGPGTWRRHLRRLTASPEHRLEVAERGRDAMGAMTYEAQAGRFYEAWMSPLKAKVAA